MKKLIALLLFSYNLSAQYIIIHRLEKSTNATKPFEVEFDGNTIGTIKKASNGFSADNFKDYWFVFKSSQTKKSNLSISNKELAFSEDFEIVPNKNYLIIFDPSLPIGDNGITALELGNWKELKSKFKFTENIELIGCEKGEISSLSNESFFDPTTNSANISKPNQENKATLNQTSSTPKVEEQNYPKSNVIEAYSYKKQSDVDQVDFQTKLENKNRIALIIGNEDYKTFQEDLSSESNVDFAMNDASAFKEYANAILGIPNERIVFALNATTGKFKQSISKTNLFIKNLGANAEVFVYYAGHGLPDEVTKEPYLIPVDVSGKNPTDGIKLKDFYGKLTEFPSKQITVFIDACFSGGARNQGLIAARGVKIKAKEDELKGNIVVFSASTGEQSSLPYKSKFHGMFTYYLLSKLKQSKGKLSYKELYDYLNSNVSMQSLSVNDKEQNPQINVSPSIEATWKSLYLNK